MIEGGGDWDLRMSESADVILESQVLRFTCEVRGVMVWREI